MSLIERAVKRVGDHPARTVPEPSGNAIPRETEASVPVQPVATIAPVTPAGVGARADAPTTPHPTTEPAPVRVQPLRIDLDRLAARGYIVPGGPPTALSQQFRVIKRPLLTNAFGHGAATVTNGRRVMVTSSLAGEGKSFCAVNLAISIAAERDHAVLLVDADVAKPSLPNELGVDTSVGLMDWLIDGTPDLDTIVRPTSIEKLSVLPAGRRDEHATEYIASGAMTRLLERLSARYPDRLIVFDSPPLLATTESRVLASYMGQIVMVVEAGNTPRHAVKEALATVGSCEVVGLVLNKARRARDFGRYGYGYGAD